MCPMIARGSYSFTCHPLTNHTCLYSPAAACITDLWLVLITPTHGISLKVCILYLFSKPFPFRHRSLTIDTPDWLSQLMGPFSVSTLLTGFSSFFSPSHKNRQFHSFVWLECGCSHESAPQQFMTYIIGWTVVTVCINPKRDSSHCRTTSRCLPSTLNTSVALARRNFWRIGANAIQ